MRHDDWWFFYMPLLVIPYLPVLMGLISVEFHNDKMEQMLRR